MTGKKRAGKEREVIEKRNWVKTLHDSRKKTQIQCNGMIIKQVWVCGVDGVVPLRCFVSVCKLSMIVNCSSD